MSESFSLMRAIFWKKIIKESDDLSDKITATINYFDGTNIICIWWDVELNQSKNTLISQIYNGVYEFTQAWKPLVFVKWVSSVSLTGGCFWDNFPL